MVKKRAIMDDGMNPEFVAGAIFDGILEIPVIRRPSKLVVPTGITPFSKRHRIKEDSEAIGFYENDSEFADFLANPERYVEELKRHIVISPDCSMYRNAPLAAQIANLYRGRAIGYFLQRHGGYVIPQVRWGNELTYTTKVFYERVAFLGVEQESILAVGTYGCLEGTENKYHFEAGLDAMLQCLVPKIVLVYGRMPNCIFSQYSDTTKFIQFPDWITRMKGGVR
jgi:hypothetical protein